MIYSGRSRIFLKVEGEGEERRSPTPKVVLTYYFANFLLKMNENESKSVKIQLILK